MNEEQLLLLREWIQEPISEEWNDDRLQAMYTIMGNDLRATAAAFWRSKAAALATVGDISENGSSRKMSELYKNALAIAASYEKVETSVTESRPYSRPIVRA